MPKPKRFTPEEWEYITHKIIGRIAPTAKIWAQYKTLIDDGKRFVDEVQRKDEPEAQP